jgi:hypothetical protein
MISSRFRQVQWRNSVLDFSSIERLRTSLEVSPQDRTLTRVPIATDKRALEFLARNEAGAWRVAMKRSNCSGNVARFLTIRASRLQHMARSLPGFIRI